MHLEGSREDYVHHRSRPILLQGHAFRFEEQGATYQQLMNKMFQGQIGKNMEVYVDDMIVKRT
jgi:hypothetical protein